MQCVTYGLRVMRSDNGVPFAMAVSSLSVWWINPLEPAHPEQNGRLERCTAH